MTYDRRPTTLLFLALLSLLSTVYFSCSSPTPPPPPPPPVVSDTTSHDFVWTVDTLGNSNASVLHTVAIFDDTTVWVGGEIFLKGPAGIIDPTPYSVALWNGYVWQSRRIYYDSVSTITSVRGIWMNGRNDIWLAAGSIFHWDGVSPQAELRFSRMLLTHPEGTVEKIWCGSSDLMYGVGHAGTVVMYDGASWRNIFSGTNMPIWDIWGATRNGATEIVAIASNVFDVPTGKALLHIGSGSIQILPGGGLYEMLSGVWFSSSGRFFLAGDGVFTADEATHSWTRWPNQPEIYTFAVRGTAPNDVVVAGSYGRISHYNGASWRHYTSTGELPQFMCNYYAVAISEHLVVAVGGTDHTPAIVTIGRR